MDCIHKKDCQKYQRTTIIFNLCFIKTRTMNEIMEALKRKDDKPNPSTIQLMLNNLVDSGHLIKERLSRTDKRGRDPWGYRRKRGM